MGLGFLNDISDKAGEIWNFFFATPQGVLILLGSFLVISLIVAALLERRTRKIYVDHPKEPEDDEYKDED